MYFFRVPIRLEFNQRQVDTKIAWFQDDSDPSLNSNAYDIAGKIVNEFFPGDFGSEGLIRGVVDMILKRVSQFNAQLESQRSGSKKNEEIVVRNPYMDPSTITSREWNNIVHWTFVYVTEDVVHHLPTANISRNIYNIISRVL